MRRSAESAYVNSAPYIGLTRAAERRAARLRADKKSAIMLIIFVMAGIFILIGMRSYAAIIQHENNLLIEENEYLQAEIDSLNSQIIEETKVTKLEKRATEDFGMVYPTPENCIKLGGKDEDEAGNLAATIRSEAYN